MPVCTRCGKETGLVGALQYNKQTGRCGACTATVNAALTRFRHAFLTFCADGLLSPDEWQSLVNGASYEGLNFQEALAFIRTDALYFLERTVAFAASDGEISDAELQAIRQVQHALGLTDSLVQHLYARIQRIQSLTAIRRGNLPTVQPTVRLDAGEVCHLEVPAVYQKVTAKALVPVSGRFIATNTRLHFLTPHGGDSVDWKRMMRIEQRGRGVQLEIAVKKMNGHYEVQDPALVEAVFDTLVRLAKRELIAPKGDTRHIPQDVKLAVWQRDQGKCVQCGDSQYLEFDHIIPHSKGGANTVNNVQLLCRRCNLAKSDRI